MYIVVPGALPRRYQSLKVRTHSLGISSYNGIKSNREIESNHRSSQGGEARDLPAAATASERVAPTLSRQMQSGPYGVAPTTYYEGRCVAS